MVKPLLRVDATQIKLWGKYEKKTYPKFQRFCNKNHILKIDLFVHMYHKYLLFPHNIVWLYDSTISSILHASNWNSEEKNLNLFSKI